jgi:hypothetical protein
VRNKNKDKIELKSVVCKKMVSVADARLTPSQQIKQKQVRMKSQQLK